MASKLILAPSGQSMIFSYSKARSIWDIFAELHVLKMYQYHKVNVNHRRPDAGSIPRWSRLKIAELELLNL